MRYKGLHLWRALQHAVFRHEEKFQDVRVCLRKELDDPAEAVIDHVSALVTDLVWRTDQIHVRGRGHGEYAANILITRRRGSTICPTSSNALEQHRRGTGRSKFVQGDHCDYSLKSMERLEPATFVP